ncbi:UNVERIFIED_CONTAM: hypothetical protein Sradi_5622400 [Sesamum radiatum]|uniref:Exocyst subunit Exo70 family protein n=1 Tax=Sesamum radiatum TaxID=300843 RepID=A0AAW2L1X4_SESRA
MYLRESWGKLPSLLSREGLILFSGGRATARNLVKQRLKSFNEAFDDMFKKQANWVIADKDLREKTCQAIIQTVVPVYRSYMQNYGPLVEQDQSASKYAKHTAQSLEKTFNSLFHPKPLKHGSFKVRHPSGSSTSALWISSKLRQPLSDAFVELHTDSCVYIGFLNTNRSSTSYSDE